MKKTEARERPSRGLILLAQKSCPYLWRSAHLVLHIEALIFFMGRVAKRLNIVN